jgi:predicted dehydrogenase
MKKDEITRREFVGDAGKLGLGALLAGHVPMIVPRHVLGGPGYRAPSDIVNFAVVGFGGMGSGNAQELAKTENLVAVCDVDLNFSQTNVNNKLRPNREGVVSSAGIKLKEQFDKAAKYNDFREMLAKQKDIDGIVVATPDHNHAVVAKAAMDMGKHVYVQKPLTWSVHEARVLGKTARENPRLVTQMGNQGHSWDDARKAVEYVWAGAIGDVREIHIWTNRPLGYWPQGIPRPQPGGVAQQGGASFGTTWNQGRVNRTLAEGMGAYPVPPDLHWDIYLGPVAEDITYHPIYHPFNWRGWIDFGAGALGDMGAHLIDHPFWALNLSYPTSVEATSTPWGTTTIPADPNAPAGSPAARNRSKPVSFPMATTVHYQFAARGNMPPVKLSWTDGGLYPPRPDVLPDDVTLLAEGGVIFIGEKGVLINDTYGANPRVYPESLKADAARVPKSMPRIEWSHELNWAKAIRGEAKASSPLEYAAQLTETMLLGVAALRAGQGRKLNYDGQTAQFINAADANQYLTREYRAGWAI